MVNLLRESKIIQLRHIFCVIKSKNRVRMGGVKIGGTFLRCEKAPQGASSVLTEFSPQVAAQVPRGQLTSSPFECRTLFCGTFECSVSKFLAKEMWIDMEMLGLHSLRPFPTKMARY